MSKAFTKEDEGSDPVVRAPPRLAPGEKRYVTPEGARAMQQALDRLSEERAALGRAPEARAQREDVERRIQMLAATLAALTVVHPNPAQEGRVFFGAWVTLEDEDGERVTYRLVGPDEADAKAGLVSVESPLGRALLGKEEGDEVTVQRPRGKAEFTVSDVRYAPPSEGAGAPA